MPTNPKPQMPQPGNRALSIRQPYVEAILRGIKKIEYRSRPTRIRGRVYLYASLQPGRPDYYAEMDVTPGSLPTGKILGTVEITGCSKIAPGSLSSGYEWHLRNPERLPEPLKPDKRPQPAWFIPFITADESGPGKPDQ